MIPQLVRSSSVVCDGNSGPPSDVSVVGMPKVEKVSIRVAARPLAPLEAGDTTGQPEYLSTSTRYADPSWWKKSAQMCWKGYPEHGGLRGCVAVACWAPFSHGLDIGGDAWPVN